MQDLLKRVRKMTLLEYILYSSVILGVVGLDQLTKILAVVYLKPIDDLPIIDGVFHFNYHINYGALGGLFANNRAVFMIVSTVMIIAASAYLYCGLAENKHIGVSLALISGGGIGNMIDRTTSVYTNNSFLNGGVVDFIYVKIIDYPIFNIADSFVCVGTFCLSFFIIISMIKEEKAKKAAAADKAAARSAVAEDDKSTSENKDEN